MRAHAPLAAALLWLPASVLAQEGPSYSFGELGYVIGSVDGGAAGDLDLTGLELNLSAELTDHFHGFFVYAEAGVDDVDSDSDTWGLGAGVQFEPVENLSFFGRLGYLDANASATVGTVVFSAGDSGLLAAGGVRYLVTSRLEIRGGLEYVDYDEAGDADNLTIGGDYFLTDVFAFGFEIDAYDDAETLLLSARIYPGRDRRSRRRR